MFTLVTLVGLWAIVAFAFLSYVVIDQWQGQWQPKWGRVFWDGVLYSLLWPLGLLLMWRRKRKRRRYSLGEDDL